MTGLLLASKATYNMRSRQSNKPQFVLLMRHAKHHRRPETRDERPTPSTIERVFHFVLSCLDIRSVGHKPGLSRTSVPHSPVSIDLTTEGIEQTREVADALRRHLREVPEGIFPIAVLPASSDEAKQTAAIMADYLKVPVCGPVDELAPPYDAEKPRRTAKHLKQMVEKRLAHDSADGKNALLVVGHQPLLGWLAFALSGQPCPISHSEILCFTGTRKRTKHLHWVLTPTDPTRSMSDLSDKIKSKMDVAKLLMTFMSAGLGLLLTAMTDKTKVAQLAGQILNLGFGAGFLFLAVILFLVCMCSYDALLMPKQFWAETPGSWQHRPHWVVARPPSSAHWILYQNMLRIWQCQFVPAAWCLMIGLLLIAIAVFIPAHDLYGAAEILAYTAISLTLLWLGREAVGRLVRHQSGPWIGSED